jgi:Zn-dependent peptidase ImmA (M78 family)
VKIPDSFTLLGCGYTVKVVKREQWAHEDCVGLFHPATNEIMLLKQPKERLEHTFLHELMHAVMHAMGREDLYKDEAFVDLTAGLIHQALTSK